MRIFEIGLLVGIFLWLLLSLKRQPKGVWLESAAINLTILILHGVIEGLRYQMVPAYLLVVLLTVIAVIKAVRRLRHFRTPMWVKIPAFLLAWIVLGASAFLATALPVFSLPEPTGEFAVGVQYFHLIDETRLDPFLDGSTRQRELIVKVYYPAEDDRAKPYLRYFRNSQQMIRAFGSFYNLPGFVFDHFRLVKTHSKEGLLISGKQDAYPAVLFSHGAGTSMEVQTSQSEDLASQGYVVVAVDHTYVSSATEFPDRIVGHKEATTNFQTAEPAEIITQIMADDLRFVIGTLEEMNQDANASFFKNRLNLERIGVIGHSVGGAAAYNLALDDPRIKAAINLDGVVYRTPEARASTVAPFLMLASDGDHVQSIQNGKSLMPALDELGDVDKSIMLSMYGSEAAYAEAQNKAQQNVTGLIEVLRGTGDLYTIAGSDHMKFTDIGLYFGSQSVRELLLIRGQLEPARCLEITQAVTRAFFDRHLRGNSSGIDTLLEQYPELKKVDLK